MFAESSASKGDFYRQLLKQSRLFLTEVDENADLQENSRSTFSSRSTSTSTSTSPPRPTARNHRRANSALALRSSSSSSPSRHPVDDQLVDTRQRCHQRLLTCSRKKLRLLNLQEQVALPPRRPPPPSRSVRSSFRTSDAIWVSNASSTVWTRNARRISVAIRWN